MTAASAAAPAAAAAVGGGYPGGALGAKGLPYEAEERATLAASSAPSSLVDGSLWSTALAASFPDTSSDGSAASRRMRVASANLQDVDWDRLWLGSCLFPYRCYAHCVDDIGLLASFLELAELPKIDGDSVKLLFRSLKFLRLCDYTAEDICSILAHASSYFRDAWALCGSQMDPSEVGHVLATLTFIAHCYVQDETCPLHIWHKHLFRKYCPLKVLNSAVIRLLQIRRHVLRLSDQELNRSYTRLLKVLHKGRVNLCTTDVFTGGEPTTSSDFQDREATSASTGVAGAAGAAGASLAAGAVHSA